MIENKSWRDMRAVDPGSEPEVTFFVPCLNEEAHVVPTLQTIERAAARAGCTYEIIVWDDHSTDATPRLVGEFAAAHPGVSLRLVRNERKRGLARNYVEGAFAGRGKWYKIVNGDNAETVEDLVAILSRKGEADIVLPYFHEDARVAGRRLLSALFTALVNALSGFHLRYYNGAVLHLRYNVMRWHSDTYGFAYQAEILTRLLGEGATYLEVPIRHVEAGGRVSKALTVENVLSVGHSLLQILLRRLRRFLFKV